MTSLSTKSSETSCASEKVEEGNETLKEKLEKFESAATWEPKRKPKKRWKKLGRPAGHPDAYRPTPEVIHQVIGSGLAHALQRITKWLQVEKEVILKNTEAKPLGPRG